MLLPRSRSGGSCRQFPLHNNTLQAILCYNDDSVAVGPGTDVKKKFIFDDKNINRIGIQSFKIGQLGDFDKIDFEKIALLGKSPETAEIVLKLTMEGPNCPQQVQLEDKRCSSLFGTPVQAISDHRKIDRVGRGVREGQNLLQKWPNLASGPSRAPIESRTHEMDPK